MRVLVTGGAGFIGSHFATRLAAAGHEVVVLDKLTYSGNRANLEGADVELVVGDICSPDVVAEAGAGCEAVINFAAETHVDRSILGAAEFIETDVLGSYVLAGWARNTGARLVQVSTDEVYGDIGEGEPSAEGDPLRPSSPYAASKAGGDLQVLAAVRTFGVDACITRGANTFGPNQYPEKLIPLFVTNALDGESLPVYGDGRQRREWLHVEDRAGHDRRYALDDSKIRGLGWSPRHSIGETGLAETVAWYRDNRAWWEPIKSGEYQRYYEEQYGARLR